MEKVHFFSSVRRTLQQGRKFPEFQHVELYGVYSDFFPFSFILFFFFFFLALQNSWIPHDSWGIRQLQLLPLPLPLPKRKKIYIYIRGGGIRNKRQISLILIITINKGDISLKIHCKLYSCLSFKKPGLKHKFWNKFWFRLLFGGADFNSQRKPDKHLPPTLCNVINPPSY